MKKHLTKWTLLVSMMCFMVAFTGCYKDDINDLKKTIAEQEAINAEQEAINESLRELLEALENATATDINNLKTLIAALEGRDYITSVTELPDNAGYKITFNSGNIIDVYHGADGQDGATGATGPQGNPGAQGPQGDKGDKGNTGDAGPAGTNGTNGAITNMIVNSDGTVTFTLDGGNKITIPGMGSGTKTDPRRIFTEDQLDDVRNNLGWHYLLMDNIELTEAWTPIGNDPGDGTEVFNGIFNGNGYTITFGAAGFNVVSGNFGLFGDIGITGRVSNLTIAGDISATNTDINIGGIAGSNAGTIENCVMRGSVTATGATITYAHAGGIAGLNGGAINNCYSTGAVTAIGTSTYTRAGGIAGQNSFGAINNCYATGAVEASGGSNTNYAGGIAGNSNGSGAAIEKCVALNSNITVTGTGTNYIGRVTGAGTGLSDNYGLTEMTGTWTNNAAGVDGANVAATAAMTTLWWTSTSALGWDWTNTWTVSIGNYPTLRN